MKGIILVVTRASTSQNGQHPAADPANGATMVGLPVSGAQEHVWRLDQMVNQGNAACNLAIRFRLQGSLDFDCLTQAFRAVLRRHDALRTTIVAMDGVPRQLVSSECRLEMAFGDLRHISVDSLLSVAEERARQEANRPFDLSRGPLIRVRLLQLGEQDHILMVTAHQIICDGWSSGIILRELTSAYEAYVLGAEPTFSPLPFNAEQLSKWEAERERKANSSQLDYWRDQLTDLPRLDLKPAKERTKNTSFAGAIETMLLPEDMTTQLQVVARQHQVTPYIILHSVYQILLNRYSGEVDLPIGTMFAGRPTVELEQLVGLFVNPVVLRCNLTGEPSFGTLLQRTMDTLAASLENQDVPFKNVVEAVAGELYAIEHPLFGANFLYQKAFLDPIQAGGLKFTPIPSVSPGSLYDLNCFLVQGHEGLRLSFEFNPQVFDRETILQFLGDYREILRTALRSPCTRIRDLAEIAVLPSQLDLDEQVAGVNTICVQDHWPAISKLSHEPLDVAVDPDSIACVIQKTEANGQSCGVQITHRGTVNLLHSMAKELGMSGGDTCLSLTPCLNDSSIIGLFFPLSVGARVLIVGQEEANDSEQFKSLVESSQATFLHTPAENLRKLIESGGLGNEELQIIFAGESPQGELGEALSSQSSSAWCLYGHPEATVVSSIKKVEPDVRSATIGRPIDNTQLYVLDPSMRQVPVGVSGELYIGGLGVAAGYRNCSEMTHQRFIPNPLGRPGSFLFRTGDRARKLSEGDVELLGRRDGQVWNKGHRIQLASVERVIEEHPCVGESVVLVFGENSSERCLVAYLVGKGKVPPDTESVRKLIQQRLPDHMIPTTFVKLSALPRTAEGTIDCASLPAPRPWYPHQHADAGPANEVDAGPVDEYEERLVDVWSELLGISGIKVGDNFFDLGGNSLLMMRLLLRVEKQFGRKISFQSFLQQPTVRATAQALHLKTITASPEETCVWALQKEGARPPLFLIDCGTNGRALGRWLPVDQPVFGVDYPLRQQLPECFTISHIANKLADDICGSEASEPYSLGGWSVAGTVAFETAKELRRRGKAVHRIFVFDGAEPVYQRRFRVWWKQPLRFFLLLDRLVYHLLQMISMSPSDALAYYRQRGMFRWKKKIKMLRQQLPNSLDWMKLYEACDNFQPTPVDVPIVLFRSCVTDGCTGLFRQNGLGWEKLADCGLEVHRMKGDHGWMFRVPEIQRLADLISESNTTA